MKTLFTLILCTLSASALAFSRGPYLPTNQEILVPYGEVVFQAGFGEDPDYYANVVWDEDQDALIHYMIGEIIIELPWSGYEVAEVEYKCYSVDDGAYGALYCESGRYLHLTVRRYETCDFGFGARRWDGFYCE